jgi:hypothetical protein
MPAESRRSEDAFAMINIGERPSHNKTGADLRFL